MGRILILGATSAMAHAYARRQAAQGATFVLAGRRREQLESNAADLRARGATGVRIVAAELADMERIPSTLNEATAEGFPDEVLLAYGALGDQALAVDDINAARESIDINFTSAALWLLALQRKRPVEQPATILVIGSVAGDRGRASNFIYGAAKGGLERFVEGLQHANVGTTLRFVLIKPGFVDTPMTAGIPGKGGPLWATADTVAADIVQATKSTKRVMYTPWFWFVIMYVIRRLPNFIFDRMKI